MSLAAVLVSGAVLAAWVAPVGLHRLTGWARDPLAVELPRLRLPTWTLIAYGVFFVVFSMVLRNLDWGPFAWFNIPYLTPHSG